MKAFVLMPFAPDFDDVFSQIIRGPLEAEGFLVGRADEPRGTRNIMHDVLQGIADADLVVADLTGANPNVYYELGVAHALGRKTILLTQDLEDVPFDLRAYRVITYSTHFARIAETIETLRKNAQEAKDGAIQFGSPFSDFKATLSDPLPISPPSAPADLSKREMADTTESDDVGLLDCFVDIKEGFESISVVVGQMGQRLTHSIPTSLRPKPS
jgi:hypothetical protein